jgi:hypothetical protein
LSTGTDIYASGIARNTGIYHTNFFHGLALNCDLSDLCLPSSLDDSHITPCLAQHFVLLKRNPGEGNISYYLIIRSQVQRHARLPGVEWLGIDARNDLAQ